MEDGPLATRIGDPTGAQGSWLRCAPPLVLVVIWGLNHWKEEFPCHSACHTNKENLVFLKSTQSFFFSPLTWVFHELSGRVPKCVDFRNFHIKVRLLFSPSARLYIKTKVHLRRVTECGNWKMLEVSVTRKCSGSPAACLKLLD